MFSINDDSFVFICNENHLNNKEYQMEKVIKSYCPQAKIVSIPEHKKGPIFAVLESMDHISLSEPTIVNYCDFTCYWSYEAFKENIFKTNCDGSIPAYRGFHPHTLWNNNYAYLKEKESVVTDIQEKEPFTKDSNNEYASSGTYYFKTGTMMKNYFKRCVDQKLLVSGEYYVSMAYKPMLDDNLAINVFELEHFMQWGTPRDLEDYLYWSDTFKGILEEEQAPSYEGVLLFPMAGIGNRFAKEGYDLPKPMIPVSGRPMAIQALSDLPNVEINRYILRDNISCKDQIIEDLKNVRDNSEFIILDQLTDGQATTCVQGSIDIEFEQPITIAACDNGMLYSNNDFNSIMEADDIDIVIWGARGYPGAIRNRHMYGWIEMSQETKLVKSISVKKPLDDPDNDPIVVGVFTFKKLSYFLDSVERMKNRKGTINNEYYVDTCINDAISLGMKCSMFEIDKYICWGTPGDLSTFEYWQSCFHKWDSHPYNLINDPNISKEDEAKLIKKYCD